MEKGGVKNVDYVFFAAYKENSDNGLWSGQKEMYEENGKMLEDFLIALDKVNGHGRTKRVVIQTGGKAYGMQFGELKAPCIESDPRVDDGVYKDTLNFYYRSVITRCDSAWRWTDWMHLQAGRPLQRIRCEARLLLGRGPPQQHPRRGFWKLHERGHCNWVVHCCSKGARRAHYLPGNL
jgi:hypothetical protein